MWALSFLSKSFSGGNYFSIFYKASLYCTTNLGLCIIFIFETSSLNYRLSSSGLVSKEITLNALSNVALSIRMLLDCAITNKQRL